MPIISALRSLRAAPGYVVAAVLTLAIGIGAATSIFSVVDAILLRPLPYADAERLVAVWSHRAGPTEAVPPSYPDFTDWRAAIARRGGPIADLAYARGDGMLLRGKESAVTVTGAFVSDGFFSVLGGRPLLGRALLPEDERPGAPRVAVLSWKLWQQQFGGDPSIVGRTVPFAQGGFTVVGVMPPGYEYPGRWAELWTPLAPQAAATAALAERLGRRNLRVDTRIVARLAPGATRASADAALAAASRALGEAHPSENRGWGAHVVPLRQELTGEVRRPLLVLMGAVALLLLVACADVANLTLVRASARARELAVRAALGGTRARLALQLLLESALIALAGGALGAALATGGVHALRAAGADLARGYGSAQSFDAVRVDGRVLAAALATAAATALLFGLLPALRGARADAQGALRQGLRGADAAGAGRRFRAGVVVAQIAVTLVMLVGAGLLGRSFLELRAQRPGFDLERLVVLRVTPPETRYRSNEEVLALLERLREAAAALPGVRSAGLVQHLAMTGAGVGSPVALAGRATDDSLSTLYRLTDGSFFATAGIPIRRGRAIEPADLAVAARAGATDVPAVVSQEFARQAWPRAEALGQRFTVFRQASGRADYRTPIAAVVVGVAADIKVASLEERAPEPTVYLPLTANPWSWGNLVVRAEGDPASLVAAVRGAVRGVDVDIPLAALTTGPQMLGRSFAERRFHLTLITAFAATALLLAAIGLYGVLATGVALRTGELGVRAALGAPRGELLSMVLRDGARLAAVGVGAGLALSLVATRVLERLVYGIGVRDRLTYAVVAALLLAVALVASWVPARRAAGVSPVDALKS